MWTFIQKEEEEKVTKMYSTHNYNIKRNNGCRCYVYIAAIHKWVEYKNCKEEEEVAAAIQ